MALPIGETPVLIGQNADIFIAQIESDLSIPSRPAPTPKLEDAKRLIIQYAAGSREK